MVRIRVLIVDGLEIACRLTRALEWIPGWNRIYQCHLAKWSNQLDARWGTDRWPTRGSGLAAWDDWERWYEGLSDTERDQGHWHAFD